MHLRTIHRDKACSVARYMQWARNERLLEPSNSVATYLHGFGCEERPVAPSDRLNDPAASPTGQTNTTGG